MHFGISPDDYIRRALRQSNCCEQSDWQIRSPPKLEQRHAVMKIIVNCYRMIGCWCLFFFFSFLCNTAKLKHIVLIIVE